MRIGLNLLYLLPGVVGGTEVYARSLVAALTETDPVTTYVAFLNTESAALDLGRAPNLTVVHCRVRAARRPARYLYEQAWLPVVARRHRIDVLHSLGYLGPVAFAPPQVVTIHDLVYVGFGEFMSSTRRRVLRFFVRATARRSRRVIAVSQASKDQIVADIGLDPARVVVVHEAGRVATPAAAPPDAGSPDAGSPAATVLDRFALTTPYVVAFSSLSASKNMARLVDAFARIATDTASHLVLVGHHPAGSDLAAHIERSGVAAAVRSTGYVADADVEALVQGAAVMAFPSLYEGFGLPVLDAQALGVPVVCSTAASLPEVAGDGALFVDPYSVDELAAALRRVLTDPALAADLVERGHANARRFSWGRAAAETLAVYRDVHREAS